ncbi:MULTISPECIES: mandelate racemase/muconate lactonizing enzyme family protein [unclassified Streptomyces]|uniref:mandelate racemase/muconate lactonizing enzyme family protein n=1 Tax=unclassified Streptomyces TaxID=2593676 RepID=UPI00224C9A90|nr:MULTISPECIES: enolase C-terminal domain-like protein [unclassified Streptomyces]MCX4988853.1 mandelate racemase [Streptomyces sp. NBC_00568]MCX5005924.1 mandelate racemase [Streptomyces sp. NBC_00638]
MPDSAAGSSARLYRVALPMSVGFDHPAARRSTSDSLVLALTLDGLTGVGECAPRAYVTGETSGSVSEALRQVPLDKLFARLRTTPARQLLDRLREDGFEATFGVDGGNNLICLLETAVLDLIGHQLDLSAGELVWPGAPVADKVAISQVLDLSIGAEEFLDTRGPFHFVKVKASDDIDRDVRTVTAIRERLGPALPVMVDANMSWTPATAVPYARRLRAAGVTLIEEPLPRRSWEDLRALRRATGVGVLLDESVCTIEDARAAVAHEACDAVNVRVAKNGGLLRSARLIEYARSAGIGFQIGVQVAETGPLINASRALALRAPDALAVEGGQSDRFFPEADTIVSPRPAVDRAANTVAPADGPGFALRLEEAAERWAVLHWTHADWHPTTSEETSP